MREFKKDDMIKCIRNVNTYERKLTEGNMYRVLRVNDQNTHMYIVDDNKNERSFQIDRRFVLSTNIFEGKSKG